MPLEIRLENEAGRLAVNGLQSTDGEGGMERNRQSLPFARRQRSSKLAMAPARGGDLEPELHKDRRNVAAR
jgi:hypothetical protein